MSDTPRWPRQHDGLCEQIEVDIGVGQMTSPCSCEVRWYQRELAELREERDELQAIVDTDYNQVAADISRLLKERRRALKDKPK